MEKERIKRKLKIYIDTSVVGGFFEKEFDVATKALFQRLEDKEIIFVVSDLLEQELQKAPQHVRELLEKYKIEGGIEFAKLTDEAKTLADCYVAEGVMTAKYIDDCRHIAIATINKIDILASWNFKHIVNLNRIRRYNAVNLMNGYTFIEIRTPKELLDYELDND